MSSTQNSYHQPQTHLNSGSNVNKRSPTSPETLAPKLLDSTDTFERSPSSSLTPTKSGNSSSSGDISPNRKNNSPSTRKKLQHNGNNLEHSQLSGNSKLNGNLSLATTRARRSNAGRSRRDTSIDAEDKPDDSPSGLKQPVSQPPALARGGSRRRRSAVKKESNAETDTKVNGNSQSSDLQPNPAESLVAVPEKEISGDTAGSIIKTEASSEALSPKAKFTAEDRIEDSSGAKRSASPSESKTRKSARTRAVKSYNERDADESDPSDKMQTSTTYQSQATHYNDAPDKIANSFDDETNSVQKANHQDTEEEEAQEDEMEEEEEEEDNEEILAAKSEVSNAKAEMQSLNAVMQSIYKRYMDIKIQEFDLEIEELANDTHEEYVLRLEQLEKHHQQRLSCALKMRDHTIQSAESMFEYEKNSALSTFSKSKRDIRYQMALETTSKKWRLETEHKHRILVNYAATSAQHTGNKRKYEKDYAKDSIDSLRECGRKAPRWVVDKLAKGRSRKSRRSFNILVPALCDGLNDLQVDDDLLLMKVVK